MGVQVTPIEDVRAAASDDDDLAETAGIATEEDAGEEDN